MAPRLHGYFILWTMTDTDYQESSSQHLIFIYKFMKTQKPNPFNVFKFSNKIITKHKSWDRSRKATKQLN